MSKELEAYLSKQIEFSEYFPEMNVLTSTLYKKQIKEILELLQKQNTIDTKSFQLYLDTIILNMHTKAKKYKKSIYFDNENIKDIENQGFTIPFYNDEKNNIYVLLVIIDSNKSLLS